jgi:hypothetical protein
MDGLHARARTAIKRLSHENGKRSSNAAGIMAGLWAPASALAGPSLFFTNDVPNDALIVKYTLTGDANLDADVNAADAALYQSKGQGRNRVTMSERRDAGVAGSRMKVGEQQRLPELPGERVLAASPSDQQQIHLEKALACSPHGELVLHQVDGRQWLIE